MMTWFAIAGVTAITALLLLLSTRGEDDEGIGSAAMRRRDRAGSTDALPPAELAMRIFSPEDRKFIRLTPSPRLQRLYVEERRKVAVHWVRQTSREVSTIMRDHRLNSRYSRNMNVAAETKLVVQYLELRLLCGVLLCLTHLFGPHVLADLASYAAKVYEQLGRAMPDVSPATHHAGPGNVAVP
ncbi:MAG TPA: hypothetical protein VFI38_05470 [Candidatus Acidoferrum sp.]|nr:hypothetical protein [Candidatus Acidoferrum sp.]